MGRVLNKEGEPMAEKKMEKQTHYTGHDDIPRILRMAFIIGTILIFLYLLRLNGIL